MFRARGCSAEESADLAQEAAIRAFMHIRRWGVTGAGLDPLLNRIARNLLIDRYRKAVPHIVPLDSADEIHDPTQDPTEEVARRQRRSAVQSAIRSLPTRHAKAITYSLSGLTPEEVGKELGIGRNAADALLHRARRSLKEHLAPVRDGMWGLALGIKIRFSRFTKGAVSTPGSAEAGSLLLQSGVGAIALAVVTTLSIAAGSTPSIAGSASQRTSAPATVVDSTSGGASSGGSGIVGGSGGTSGTGSVEHVFLFGAASRSASNQGSTTTINGPKDEKGRPIATITRRTYGTNGPDPSDPVGVTLDSVMRGACSSAKPLCW